MELDAEGNAGVSSIMMTRAFVALALAPVSRRTQEIGWGF